MEHATDLPETITTNARITYSVQDKYSSVWTVRVDVTDKDGTQFHYILSVNTHTGECQLAEL